MKVKYVESEIFLKQGDTIIVPERFQNKEKEVLYVAELFSSEEYIKLLEDCRLFHAIVALLCRTETDEPIKNITDLSEEQEKMLAFAIATYAPAFDEMNYSIQEGIEKLLMIAHYQIECYCGLDAGEFWVFEETPKKFKLFPSEN